MTGHPRVREETGPRVPLRFGELHFGLRLLLGVDLLPDARVQGVGLVFVLLINLRPEAHVLSENHIRLPFQFAFNHLRKTLLPRHLIIRIVGGRPHRLFGRALIPQVPIGLVVPPEAESVLDLVLLHRVHFGVVFRPGREFLCLAVAGKLRLIIV